MVGNIILSFEALHSTVVKYIGVCVEGDGRQGILSHGAFKSSCERLIHLFNKDSLGALRMHHMGFRECS